MKTTALDVYGQDAYAVHRTQFKICYMISGLKSGATSSLISLKRAL